MRNEVRKKLFFLLFLILLPSPAWAAHQCLIAPPYDAYSLFFQNTKTVSGISYSPSELLFYVLLQNGFINGYVGVNQTIVTSFFRTKTPDVVYTNRIVSTITGHPPFPFHETLMTETCQNLMTEDGKYITLQ